MTPESYLRVVACNYREPTSAIAKGAKAIVLDFNPGNAAERILVLIRSCAGRWIKKWETPRRLGNFRVKTEPNHQRLTERWQYTEDHSQDATLQRWCDYLNARGWDTSPGNPRNQTVPSPLTKAADLEIDQASNDTEISIKKGDPRPAPLDGQEE